MKNGTRIIPVILRSAESDHDIPLFLRSHTRVDFRSGQPEPLELLIRGLTRNQKEFQTESIREFQEILKAPGLDKVLGGAKASFRDCREQVRVLGTIKKAARRTP